MSAATNNVVGLHNRSVFKSISIYLTKVESRSKKTRLNYEKAIRRFFMWKNKTLEELTIEDLDIINEQMIEYQAHLKDDFGYSNNYVNVLVAPIAKLYDHFSRNRYNVNPEDVRLDKLHNDGEKWGRLTHYEAEEMAVLVRTKKKGLEKSCFIRVAYRTSFRKSSLLSLRWSDFEYREEEDLYLVSTIGKGKKPHTRPIPVELYEEILKIKEQNYYKRYSDDFVFHLSETTIQAMIDELKIEMNISDERNIAFHSLRNVAADYIMSNGGTIEDARDQLAHSGYGSLTHYLHTDKNYSEMAGVKMGETLSEDYLSSLSKDELIQIIFQQNESTQLTLQKCAKKMIAEREEG